MKITENIKIHVKNEDESRRVQEWAIRQGYSWGSGISGIDHTQKPCLLLDFSRKTMSYSDDLNYFVNHDSKEVMFKKIFPEFKVGDNVKYEGEIVPIMYITKDFGGIFQIQIRKSNGSYVWVGKRNIQKIEEQKFKVGDKVRLLGTKHMNGLVDVFICTGFEKGDIRRIDEICSDGNITIGGYYFSSGDLELVKEVKNMEFKVGDRVRCIKEHDSNTEIINKVGTVTVNSGFNTTVQFDQSINGWGDDKCKWCFTNKDNCLEKIEDESIKTKTNEVNKMELKNIKKENLNKAKEIAEKDIKSQEVEFAVTRYRELTDEINRYDREIKVREENKKELLEERKLFDKK